jgi:hypothetical protein
MDNRSFPPTVSRVSPIPADAPPKPAIHPQLGKPVAVYTYCLATGEPDFFVWRFEPPNERKQFSVLTLWRDAAGRMRWDWKKR